VTSIQRGNPEAMASVAVLESVADVGSFKDEVAMIDAHGDVAAVESFCKFFGCGNGTVSSARAAKADAQDVLALLRIERQKPVHHVLE